MSFEQKYLKYKSKYLALKAQLNTISVKSQNGGSIYGTSLDQLDFLSETPSNNKNLYNELNNQNNQKNDYKLSGGNTESASEKSASEKSTSEKSEEEKSASEKSEEEKSETPASEEEEESEQGGGSKQSKGKSHKKYFFDDSDINLDSTTTDSDLSSLKTDSTDD